jgi:hypothetical protein
MDEHFTFSYVLLLISGVVVFTYVTWCFTRARFILYRWAKDNGFHLLNFKAVVSGPPKWDWTSSRSQVLYSVHICNKDGQERRGWVRCGSFWAGVFSDKVEVKWQDET